MPESKDKKDTDPNAAMLTVLTGLQKTMTELPGVIEKSVTTSLSRAIPKAPVDGTKKAEPKKRDPVTDEALEGMDRKGLVAHIVAEISEQLITPLREELVKTTSDAQTDKLKSTWVSFMGDPKNKAMMEGLKDEVAAVIKEKPSLAGDPESILVIAKNKAPQKVKDLEEAAAKTADDTNKTDDKEPSTAKKAEADNAKKIATAFGGLEPSSGTPGASDDTKPEKVGLHEAANRAYDEVLAALPGSVTGT